MHNRYLRRVRHHKYIFMQEFDTTIAQIDLCISSAEKFNSFNQERNIVQMIDKKYCICLSVPFTTSLLGQSRWQRRKYFQDNKYVLFFFSSRRLRWCKTSCSSRMIWHVSILSLCSVSWPGETVTDLYKDRSELSFEQVSFFTTIQQHYHQLQEWRSPSPFAFSSSVPIVHLCSMNNSAMHGIYSNVSMLNNTTQLKMKLLGNWIILLSFASDQRLSF